MADHLYDVLRRHASVRPTATAMSHRGEDLAWAQVLADVDCRARAIGSGGLVVLREDDRLGFVLDYLAAQKTGAVVVIDDGGPPTNGVVELVRDRTSQLRRFCPGGPEILFTSGSTARAKAIVLDGAEMVGKAAQINAAMGDPDGNLEVLSVPLRHSFGLGRLRCALLAGRAVHFTDRLPSADAVFDAVSTGCRATLGLISSTVKLLLARHSGELARHIDRIAQIEIGSEPLEVEYRKELTRLLPRTRLVLSYGMTELSRMTMVDLHQEIGGQTVGRAMPRTEMRVAGDGPTDLRRSGEGDLYARGAAMVRAYLAEGDVRPVDPRTWLATGDHGAIDHDGVVTVRGRRSEMVKIMGKKVVPEETQRAIRQLTGALECLCVPLELTAGVFILAALVVPAPDTDVDPVVLHGYLRATLPPHQLPRRIITVPRLPRLPSGKIDRRAAIALAA